MTDAPDLAETVIALLVLLRQRDDEIATLRGEVRRARPSNVRRELERLEALRIVIATNKEVVAALEPFARVDRLVVERPILG